MHNRFFSKAEKEKPYLVLGEFNQADYTSAYKQTTGQCWGITHFWLLLHTFSSCADMHALSQDEARKFKFIYDHFFNIIKLQKWLNGNLTDYAKKGRPALSHLHIHAFDMEYKESNTEPLIESPIVNDTSETQTELIAKLVRAVKIALLCSTKKAAIEFTFGMKDATGHEKGHALGIIKNPCPGCEIAFFDCNFRSIAFKTTAVFLTFIHLHFRTYFTEGIEPTEWNAACLTVADIIPEIQILVDSFQDMKSDPTPDHHIIDIRPC